MDLVTIKSKSTTSSRSASVVSLSSEPSSLPSPQTKVTSKKKLRSSAKSSQSSSPSTPMRVQVSWEQNKPSVGPLNLDGDGRNNSTPSRSDKVTRWFDANKTLDLSQSTPDTIGGVPSMVCARFDFNKDSSGSSKKLSPVLFNHNHNVNINNNNGPGDNGSGSVTTLGNKKSELCNYLELVRPSIIKSRQHEIKQNRRSVRTQVVKNPVANGKAKPHQKVSYSNFDEFEKVVGNVMNYPAIKSFDELHMKIEKIAKFLNYNLSDDDDDDNENGRILRLPPESIYQHQVDFEDSVKDIVKEVDKPSKRVQKKAVTKKQRFNFELNLRRNKRSALRSTGLLKNVHLDSLIKTKEKTPSPKKKKRKQSTTTTASPVIEEPPGMKQPVIMLKKVKLSLPQIVDTPLVTTPHHRVEIVSVSSDEEDVDLDNFIDDMMEIEMLSEEHRRSVIESRILSSGTITGLMTKKQRNTDVAQKAYKIFSDLSSPKSVGLDHCYARTEDELNNGCLQTRTEEIVTEECKEDDDDVSVTSSSSSSSSASSCPSNNGGGGDEIAPSPLPPDLQVKPPDLDRGAVNRSLLIHLSPRPIQRRSVEHNGIDPGGDTSHNITVDTTENGQILRTFYTADFRLVLIQQRAVSFWAQSALGNVLGAQDMWLFKGRAQRIALNVSYAQKDALEMVFHTLDNSLAYVELWTKEHKSEYREVPLADIFVTVYFWRHGMKEVHKKSLQLENIKGYSHDVQYVVLKYAPCIIVSWYACNEKSTRIRSYYLARDFQTVANIGELQRVPYCVSSLHNIEGSEGLVMGNGTHTITLWNVEFGNILTTIELSNIQRPLATLWVKSDKGFLFAVQECEAQELRLIAINGRSQSWKTLKNYQPPTGLTGLREAYMENGILVAHYAEGIHCWNTQTGDSILSHPQDGTTFFPCGKHVAILSNKHVIVKHALTLLISFATEVS